MNLIFSHQWGITPGSYSYSLKSESTMFYSVDVDSLCLPTCSHGCQHEPGVLRCVYIFKDLFSNWFHFILYGVYVYFYYNKVADLACCWNSTRRDEYCTMNATLCVKNPRRQGGRYGRTFSCNGSPTLLEWLHERQPLTFRVSLGCPINPEESVTD